MSWKNSNSIILLRDLSVLVYSGCSLGFFQQIYNADVRKTPDQQNRLDIYYNCIIIPNSVICGLSGIKVILDFVKMFQKKQASDVSLGDYGDLIFKFATNFICSMVSLPATLLLYQMVSKNDYECDVDTKNTLRTNSYILIGLFSGQLAFSLLFLYWLFEEHTQVKLDKNIKRLGEIMKEYDKKKTMNDKQYEEFQEILQNLESVEINKLSEELVDGKSQQSIYQDAFNTNSAITAQHTLLVQAKNKLEEEKRMSILFKPYLDKYFKTNKKAEKYEIIHDMCKHDNEDRQEMFKRLKSKMNDSDEFKNLNFNDICGESSIFTDIRDWQAVNGTEKELDLGHLQIYYKAIGTDKFEEFVKKLKEIDKPFFAKYGFIGTNQELIKQLFDFIQHIKSDNISEMINTIVNQPYSDEIKKNILTLLRNQNAQLFINADIPEDILKLGTDCLVAFDMSDFKDFDENTIKSVYEKFGKLSSECKKYWATKFNKLPSSNDNRKYLPISQVGSEYVSENVKGLYDMIGLGNDKATKDYTADTIKKTYRSITPEEIKQLENITPQTGKHNFYTTILLPALKEVANLGVDTTNPSGEKKTNPDSGLSETVITARAGDVDEGSGEDDGSEEKHDTASTFPQDQVLDSGTSTMSSASTSTPKTPGRINSTESPVPESPVPELLSPTNPKNIFPTPSKPSSVKYNSPIKKESTVNEFYTIKKGKVKFTDTGKELLEYLKDQKIRDAFFKDTSTEKLFKTAGKRIIQEQLDRQYYAVGQFKPRKNSLQKLVRRLTKK